MKSFFNINNIHSKLRNYLYSHELINEIKRNKIIYTFVLFSTVLVYIFLNLLTDNLTIEYKFTTYIKSLLNICIKTFLIWTSYEYLTMLINKIEKPTYHWLIKIKSLLFPLHRPVLFLVTLIFLNVTFSTYSYIKVIIPEINPYYLDDYLYNLDKLIHFNESPWEITHYWFSHPLATLFIDFLYQVWFLVMWVFLVFFIIYRKNETLRNQFILTFLSCWLFIGSLIATLLSSVGPCFIYLLDNTQTQFLTLFETLNTQSDYIKDNYYYSLKAIEYQNLLWNIYIQRSSGIGVGISAMPSMHVSMAVLMALVSYRLNKSLCLGMWIYAFFIQIGSVHLGWHYAVDGYVSFVLTVFLWYIWGWICPKLTLTKK